MIGRIAIATCLLALFSPGLSAQSPVALQYHPDLVGWPECSSPPLGFSSFNLDFWKSNLEKTPAPPLAEIRWQALEFNVDDLPVFCRLEVKMEHLVRFPVKFRLGEVQYVEGLEGKY